MTRTRKLVTVSLAGALLMAMSIPAMAEGKQQEQERVHTPENSVVEPEREQERLRDSVAEPVGDPVRDQAQDQDRERLRDGSCTPDPVCEPDGDGEMEQYRERARNQDGCVLAGGDCAGPVEEGGEYRHAYMHRLIEGHEWQRMGRLMRHPCVI